MHTLTALSGIDGFQKGHTNFRGRSESGDREGVRRKRMKVKLIKTNYIHK